MTNIELTTRDHLDHLRATLDSALWFVLTDGHDPQTCEDEDCNQCSLYEYITLGHESLRELAHKLRIARFPQ